MPPNFPRALLAIVGLSALTGCVDLTSGSSGSGIPIRDRAAIQELGFSTRHVVDRGRYYVVEGDIAIDKEHLHDALEAASRPKPVMKGAALEKGWRPWGPAEPPRSRASRSPVGPRFQYRATTLVDQSRVRNIRVDLSALASEPAWQNAARQAMTEWNAIVGAAINFTEGAPGDIVIQFEDFGNTQYAALAALPRHGVNGGPGPLIRINTQFIWLNNSVKLTLLAHELGHTIGFRHTNWQEAGEDPGIAGAHGIYGTPQVDPNSVMNHTVGSWSGFSSYDERAAITLYGDQTPVSVFNSGGSPLISWDPMPGAVQYNVYVTWQGWESWWDGYDYNTYFETYVYASEYVGTTYGTSLLDPSVPYNGVYVCWRRSDPDIRWSGGEKQSGYVVEAVFANGQTQSPAFAPVCEPSY